MHFYLQIKLILVTIMSMYQLYRIMGHQELISLDKVQTTLIKANPTTAAVAATSELALLSLSF